MKVLKLAQVPAPAVSSGDTVREAVGIMAKLRVGAAAVLEADKFVGIFTERDVMLRVVHKGRNADETLVRDVMTTAPDTVEPEMESGVALELMVKKHIRHLPIVKKDGSLAGLLSIRNLLHFHVDHLADQLNSLEAYFTADGPGG